MENVPVRLKSIVLTGGGVFGRRTPLGSRDIDISTSVVQVHAKFQIRCFRWMGLMVEASPARNKGI